MNSRQQGVSKISSSIGIRLRQIREAKCMTQQELELAIDSSFGHVSRIESGHVNPSKETLVKISDALQLTARERQRLEGISLKHCSEREISDAIAKTEQYIDISTYPAYLADDLFHVYRWNQPILKLFGVSDEYATSFLQRTNVEIIFHPLFRQLMSPDRWDQLVQNQLGFFIKEIDYPAVKQEQCIKELLQFWKEIDGFSHHWDRALKEQVDGIVPGENVIHFTVDGKEVSFFESVTKVSDCPRFRITEYIPR